MQFSIYSQGLQRSRSVFIMQRLILLCLYTGGVSFAFFLPVFEFSLDYVIIWQLHIWLHCLAISPRATAGEQKAKCSRIAVSICFLSAGCQQVIVSIQMMFQSSSFNCCRSVCSGWNTESDNNTQFQLNSLMCDLYLRNCFLLQSEVFRTLQHFVGIYANIAWVFHGNMQKFCIIWHSAL